MIMWRKSELKLHEYRQLCGLHKNRGNFMYVDIAEDVETRFDTSNYELGRPLPKGKNKKVIELIKGEIMTELATLTPKTYTYLKETQTFKAYLTESNKYYIIIAGSNTRMSKTHGLLSKFMFSF